MANIAQINYYGCMAGSDDRAIRAKIGSQCPQWYANYLMGIKNTMPSKVLGLLTLLSNGKWKGRLDDVNVSTVEACQQVGLIEHRPKKGTITDTGRYTAEFRITLRGKQAYSQREFPKCLPLP